MKKAARHARIRDIIGRQAIETQDELAEALRQMHIDVTQATVSRDIKELMLIKVPIGDGRYRYAYPASKDALFSNKRMERLFQDSVTGMDFSENIIVVKTLPGTANAVASALDHAGWPDILGTVAGDDSILVVVKPKEAAGTVMKKLEALTMAL
ncbi:MAG: arginine repressor [Selenomonadaceae bacterium]|nr:arginine repressor [Selenomonadaceae bacterium]MBR6710786.1 arginine repressor [Selenomonadaceae bacterium]MBR6906861.1 arginine repressor [Selenomonadaceae bacterium]